MSAQTDTVDLVDVGRSLRREWRRLVLGVALGLLGAGAVLLFVRRQFAGAATILLRTDTDNGSSLLARMGVPTDVGSGGSPLSSAIKSPIETELQILQSRSAIGAVVDSLGLQARVLDPSGTPVAGVLVPRVYPGSFKRRVYYFSQDGTNSAYRVTGGGASTTASPGQGVRLPTAVLVLRRDSLPASFSIEIQDREDAITTASKRLSVEKTAGEVARVTFSANDSLTAAAVPNAIIATYLGLRKTTDRGLNQHRLEFLTAHSDTVARNLAAAERALRREQEASGVVDPEVSGKAELEQAISLEDKVESLKVEEQALGQMIQQVSSGTRSPREIAAYPAFLKSPAINEFLTQITTLETQRLKLLELRTEKDPEVQANERAIERIEAQILPLARAYAASLLREHSDLGRQLDTVRTALAALPAQSESSVRLQREVKRLSQNVLALQTQLLETRLAAITEGGRVRQVDVAYPPKRVSFPRPLPTLGIGLALGFLLGLIAALYGAYMGRWIRRPEDVERAAGIPGLALHPGAPLLLGDGVDHRTVLVVPLGEDAPGSEVARQLAETAASRGEDVQLVEESGAADGSASAGALRRVVTELEGQRRRVVSVLPPLTDPRTAALLDRTRPVLFVARAGRVDRGELRRAAETLRRAAVPSLGVVLGNGDGRNGSGRG